MTARPVTDDGGQQLGSRLPRVEQHGLDLVEAHCVSQPGPRAAAHASGFSTRTSAQATTVDSIVVGSASMTEAFSARPPSGPVIVDV
ncbi:hypothetical protein ACWCQZ_46575 [Streptomyces sp. NPDC002285]